TGHMVLRRDGAVVADIPLAPLADEAPLYDRPWLATAPPAPLADVPDSSDVAGDLVRLIASPDLASRRWIWEQYDHMVGADTVQRPGGDAAVVRVHGSDKAIAISTDVTPRYCFADPVEGGKQAIAECYRNLCAVGAVPLAATDCMNFGNPQRPEIMGQFVGCIEGMADACRALDFPIVSGNVSLYNETKSEDGRSSAILPTPAIGGIGLLADWRKAATLAFKAGGEAIFLIGGPPSHLGQSIWLREVHGREEGPPPPVDLAAERRNGEFIRDQIGRGSVTAVHDISDGGLAVAIAEMALAGGIGAQWKLETSSSRAAAAFGEDQGRYVVTSDEALGERAAAAGVACTRLGTTGGAELRIDLGGVASTMDLERLRRAHEGYFPTLMGPDAALA
ncbi:MAG TPA: AIR synthase related protein, partial [Allosphingosinicella sp.]|nr:AIR synthase related protein [Allosphingosinicella sp.]